MSKWLNETETKIRLGEPISAFYGAWVSFHFGTKSNIS